MGARQTEPVRRAIALLRADPQLTRYAAAKRVGITPGALYHSRECRELMATRKETVQNTEKQ